jgi:hypothetical protein
VEGTVKDQILLGFGNKARQGKDTAASGVKRWCSQNDFPVLHVGFADALRIEVSNAIRDYGYGDVYKLLDEGFNDNGEHINIPSYIKATENPAMDEPLCPYGKHAKILQWWGTEFRRAQNPNYWVDKFKESVVGFKGVVIAADTRFTNEAIAVLELGGSTANVRRLNEDGTQYFDSSRPAGHQSEVELDSWNWDYRIIAKTGQVSLVEAQAVEILKYEMRLKNGWVK